MNSHGCEKCSLAPVAGDGERGSVVTLIIMSILLLITIVGINLSGTSEFQLLISRNETSRSEAIETSQSAIDYALSSTANLIPNATTCTTNVGCANAIITLPTPPFDTTLTQVQVDSIGSTALPIVSGTSADMYEAAAFNIRSRYDGTSAGEGGKITINQGVIMLIPAGH